MGDVNSFKSLLADDLSGILPKDSPTGASIAVSKRRSVISSHSWPTSRSSTRKGTSTSSRAETTGFIKALIGANDDTILGFAAFGQSAGELMATVQLAMSAKLPYTAVRDSIFTHPTYFEGLVYLFSSAPTQVSMSTHATG
jgi:pyruvate/2-oxoglutarate dehydrogenase complex dihydrolipoamide dehydrogenase (E3) component